MKKILRTSEDNQRAQLENEIARLQKKIAKYEAVELKQNQYGLVWLDDVQEAFEDDVENKLPILQEMPKLAINSKDDKPTHMLIEGDNYHALTCLNYTHKGKVDLIYIDPPYNTGSDGFKYKDKRILDKFSDGTDVPIEHPLRHSYWLSFMKKRLELAKDLLKSEGSIYISIDDNEYAQLKLLCDEIFGEANFVTTVAIKMSYLSGVKMSHLDKKLPKLKEYLLIYARNKNNLSVQPVYEAVLPEKAFARYKSFLVRDEEEPHNTNKWKVISLRQAMLNAKVDLDDLDERNKFYLENADSVFRTARNRSEHFLNLPSDDKFRKIKTASGKERIAYKKEEVTFISAQLRSNGTDVAFMQPLGDLWTDIAINNLHNEGGVEFKNGKKPLKLIERVVRMNPNKNAIVLDFFAGSGTVGQAVMELNESDGGRRQFVLVTNNAEIVNGTKHKIMDDICYPRIKNVIKGYSSYQGLGNSIKYFKTAFVGKNNILKADDRDKIELAQNAGSMLAIAENTFNQIEKTNHWQMFENEKRCTAIYFREEFDKFEQFVEKVKKIKKVVAVYIFSWEKELDFDEFDGYNNIAIKTIPQPILEVYRQIYNLI